MFCSTDIASTKETEESVSRSVSKTDMLMSTLKKEATRIGRGSMVMRLLRDNSDPNESADPTLLKKWYQLDKNYRPHVYKLKKIR